MRHQESLMFLQQLAARAGREGIVQMLMKLLSHLAVITRTMSNFTCLSRENLQGAEQPSVNLIKVAQPPPHKHTRLQTAAFS